MADFTDFTKFKALIQPIKDLAMNWDIDVAENLNEYLEELEHIRISLDGGHTQLNFAEAALLIQGSTAIYSKKVEYLHQLVLKSLEYITNKKSTILNKTNDNDKEKSSANQSHALGEEIFAFGNDPSLLLLDDLIEEGHNIDLKVNNASTKTRFSTESEISNIANVSRMSLSLMHSMFENDQGVSALRLSTSYLHPSGALLIGGLRPLFNKATETSLFLGDDMGKENIENNANKFPSPIAKVNDSVMGTEGMVAQAAVSDGLADYVGHDDMMYDDDGGGGNYDDYMHVDGDMPPSDTVPLSTATTIPSVPSSAIAATIPVRAPLSEYNDPSSAMDVVPTTSLPTATTTTSATSSAATLSATEKASKQQQQHTVHFQKTFVMLDPHEVTPGSRPLKKSRTYRIPTSLHKPTNREGGGDTTTLEIHMTPEDMILEPIRKQHHTFNLLYCSSSAIPSFGLFETSLLPLYKVKQKLVKRQKMMENMHRTNTQKQQQGNDDSEDTGIIMTTGGGSGGGGGRVSSNDMYDDEFMWDDGDRHVVGGTGSVSATATTTEGTATTALTTNNTKPIVSTNEDAADAMNYGTQDDYFDDGDGGGMDDFFPEEFAEQEQNELTRRVDEALNHDDINGDGLLSTKPSSSSSSSFNTYEMICQQYIDGFHRGANAYARETQLSKRVLEWTLKLEPLLQKQEDSAPFDIHEYSDVVLGRLSHLMDEKIQHKMIEIESINESKDNNLMEEDVPNPKVVAEETEITFRELVDGQNSSEVCRIFLACLQLANLGNLEVLPDDHSRVTKRSEMLVSNDFGLKLHSAERARDIENFFAPSIQQHPAVASQENPDELGGNNATKGGRKTTKPRKK